MVARIVVLGLVWLLAGVGAARAQSADPSAGPPAHAATAREQMGMQGMSTGTAAGMTGSRAVTVGVGAVAGYVLMMNPYGIALMGAAMGGMLADWMYGSYQPAPKTGL